MKVRATETEVRVGLAKLRC